MTLDRDEFNAAVIKEIGIYTQKTLTTLNAGAILALLTFVGNVDDNETVVFDVNLLKYSGLAFIAGLLFVGVSLFTTYLRAQREIGKLGNSDADLSRFMVGVAGPPILSFAAFLIGILLAFAGIRAA